MKRAIGAISGALALAVATRAQAAPVAGGTISFGDTGDTAWLLAATALALLAVLPGLALFFAGQVRARSALSVVIAMFATVAAAGLVWIAVGYSLAFSENTGWIGGYANFWLNAMGTVRDGTTVPETAFALFQMSFALLAPALLVGALIERARFGWLVVVATLWTLLVYLPVTHWLWGSGWLAASGALDYAGGIVVYLAAGVSALVAAAMLGRRAGWPDRAAGPHSPLLALVGAGLLWIGAYGLAGGSALTAGDDAASAILATHIAASTAALTWALIERVRTGRVTALGLARGTVAGLATIAPAAAYVGMGGALLIGASGAILCAAAVSLVRERLRVDDSLDIFALFGVGGLAGALLTALFIAPAVGGTGYAPDLGLTGQLIAQLLAVAAVAGWSALGTLIIGYAVSFLLPMRVSADHNHDDADENAEQAWDID